MRTIVLGGPQSGKSTYAKSLNVPHFCGDPKSLVKNLLDSVTYLPEGLDWSNGSIYMLKWFAMPGPWVIEGVGVVRALRKFNALYPNVKPSDKIVFFNNPHPSVTVLPWQAAMKKGIDTIWSDISASYKSITEYINW